MLVVSGVLKIDEFSKQSAPWDKVLRLPERPFNIASATQLKFNVNFSEKSFKVILCSS